MIVFKAFDMNDAGTLNENEFFELGKTLQDGGIVSLVDKSQGQQWTKEASRKAYDDIMRHQDGINDFTVRNMGKGRVPTVDEFVEYFMEKMKDVTDESFDNQVSSFIVASIAAREYIRAASERSHIRREKLIAVYKVTI